MLFQIAVAIYLAELEQNCYHRLVDKMLTEPREVIAFVTALVLLLQNVSGEMIRLQEVREECEECESASAAVGHGHSAVTQMSQILACVLHDIELVVQKDIELPQGKAIRQDLGLYLGRQRNLI